MSKTILRLKSFKNMYFFLFKNVAVFILSISLKPYVMNLKFFTFNIVIILKFVFIFLLFYFFTFLRIPVLR